MTVLKDTKIIDQWRFTILPGVLTHAEAGTIDEKTSTLRTYAPPDYSGANVAGLLAAPAHIATWCVPACTSQFFERLKPNKPSDPRESRPVVVGNELPSCASNTPTANEQNMLIASGFKTITPKTTAQQQKLQALPPGSWPKLFIKPGRKPTSRRFRA